MPRNKRDKTTGLPLPSPVVPETSICFSIQVPNAIEYRSAFKGALAILGQAWTWSQTAGSDNQASYDAAELWRERLQEAFYSIDCEGEPMSCADVANCIETNEAVQEAIAQQIANNPSNQTTVYNTTTYGTPMTSAQAAQAVITSPECDLDSLFGSVTNVLDQLDQNNRDFLEIVEVGTNTRERLSNIIAAIPLLETLPIDDAIAFADKLQSEILENYEAQWTTALRDEYRCDLFCIAQDNPECELSFDDLFNYYNDRLGAALEPINFFTAVLQYFLLGTWSGSTVVDIMMLVQLGTWRQASTWSGVSLRTLQTVGLLGANNPDGDWEIIPCEDCNPPVEDCYDFTAGEQGFAPWVHPISGLPAATHTGGGWDTGYNSGFSAIIREFEGTITRVKITLFEETPTDASVLVQVLNLALTAGVNNETPGLSVYDFTGLSITDGLYINVQTSTPWTSTQKIVEVCIEFAP